MDVSKMLSTNKLKTVILRRASKSSAIFDMFEQSGKVVIGFSGGADSLVLTDILYEMSRRWQRKISFYPIFVNQGYYSLSNDERNNLEKFCSERNMKLQILQHSEIADIIASGKNPFPPCFTCSRMRRKALLETANEMGANIIALGHHKDDLIETFMLNILFSRRISAIMPKQELFSRLFHIVRPLILTDESYIKRYATLRAFPIVKKDCPYAKGTQRVWIKKILTQLELARPGIKNNIVRALFHPKPDYLWGQYEPIIEKLLK